MYFKNFQNSNKFLTENDICMQEVHFFTFCNKSFENNTFIAEAKRLKSPTLNTIKKYKLNVRSPEISLNIFRKLNIHEYKKFNFLFVANTKYK